MNVVRHSREFLAQVLGRPAMSELVRQTSFQIVQEPDKCVVVGQKQSTIQIRVGSGKRTWVSMRALLWMQEEGLNTDTDPPTFGPPICGTPGCVTPNHQQLRKDTQRIRAENAQPV